MTGFELHYFTHTVEGNSYGAWYRIISPTQIEVMGLGMLEVVEYAGFSPESAAKSILESFVKQRSDCGMSMDVFAISPTSDDISEIEQRVAPPMERPNLSAE